MKTTTINQPQAVKDDQNHLRIRNLNEGIALLVFLLIMLIVSFFQDAKAQRANRFQNDPHFPVKGKFNAGLITTYAGIVPPPVLIGDLTYGVSNKFSVGVVGGTTGALALYGFKLSALVFHEKNFRVFYRMTSIYYPERNGKFLFDRADKHVMPWMLSMGLVDAEWRTQKGVRWSLGMGLLETHCIDGMMNLIFNRTPGAAEEAEELPFDVFNTVQGSISIPLSRKLTLRPEVIAVLKGTEFINRAEHKVGPLNIYLSFVYSF